MPLTKITLDYVRSFPAARGGQRGEIYTSAVDEHGGRARIRWKDDAEHRAKNWARDGLAVNSETGEPLDCLAGRLVEVHVFRDGDAPAILASYLEPR